MDWSAKSYHMDNYLVWTLNDIDVSDLCTWDYYGILSLDYSTLIILLVAYEKPLIG